MQIKCLYVPTLETERLLLRELVPEDAEDLGRWLGSDELYTYWGRGLCTEALGRAVGFIFSETPLDRLQGNADVRNTASNRVLQKSGFKLEGTIRHGKMVSCYCDYNIWGLIREDICGTAENVSE